MDTVEVKTTELIGAALDYATGIASGSFDEGEYKFRAFQPSTDWSQCGPLIEKHKVSIDVQPRSGRWDAFCSGWVNNCETPMIAACIAIVKAKLGETVSIPAELLK